MHQHIEAGGNEISMGCVLLFSGTNVLGWLSGQMGAMTLLNWAQFIAVMASFAASVWIWRNQNKTLKWKNKGGEGIHVKKHDSEIQELKKMVEELKQIVKSAEQPK